MSKIKICECNDYEFVSNTKVKFWTIFPYMSLKTDHCVGSALSRKFPIERFILNLLHYFWNN